MNPVLSIQNIEKTFNRDTVNIHKALDGLSLTLERGDYVTVIGGNGAGKSTLLNAISGSVMPDRGNIIIDGADVTKMPEYKRAGYLGRVFQDPMVGTAGKMTVRENLALAYRRGEKRGLNRGISKENEDYFRQILADLDLGMEDRLDAQMGLLSGGQRQAITLLMATIQKPRILLLDEHTAALDPKTAAKVLTLTDKIVKEQNLTTLMITHNMKDAIKHGNRLIMMDKGRIVLDIRGEEKRKLTVNELLRLFEQKSGTLSDRMLLS